MTVGATYVVRGKIGFSHVAKPTTDEERALANKRRTHPVDKNYTSISIFDAQVVCKDPASPSIEEKYAAECFYKSSSPAYPGNNFSAMNKSRNLPKIGVLSAPNKYDEIFLDGRELATGLDVLLVMRVFKGQGNNGVSLDTVLVNEPVRFFQGGNGINEQLSSYCIVFTAASPSAVPAEQPAVAQAPVATMPADTSAVSQSAPVTTDPATQAAPVAPATAAQPAQAPVMSDNPFSSMAAEPITFGPGTRTY